MSVQAVIGYVLVMDTFLKIRAGEKYCQKDNTVQAVAGYALRDKISKIEIIKILHCNRRKIIIEKMEFCNAKQ